ncbi:MAG TPA: hypothetical protein VF541_14255 [Longimicrobium sp.]|jgi:hypothetical protein
MKKAGKLSLAIDTLAVESFPVSDHDQQLKGTVEAAEYSVQTAQCGSCQAATCFTSCSPQGDPRCTCPVSGLGC